MQYRLFASCVVLMVVLMALPRYGLNLDYGIKWNGLPDSQPVTKVLSCSYTACHEFQWRFG